MKCQRLTSSSCKDIEISIFGFVSKIYLSVCKVRFQKDLLSQVCSKAICCVCDESKDQYWKKVKILNNLIILKNLTMLKGFSIKFQVILDLLKKNQFWDGLRQIRK